MPFVLLQLYYGQCKNSQIVLCSHQSALTLGQKVLRRVKTPFCSCTPSSPLLRFKSSHNDAMTSTKESLTYRYYSVQGGNSLKTIQGLSNKNHVEAMNNNELNMFFCSTNRFLSYTHPVHQTPGWFFTIFPC